MSIVPEEPLLEMTLYFYDDVLQDSMVRKGNQQVSLKVSLPVLMRFEGCIVLTLSSSWVFDKIYKSLRY